MRRKIARWFLLWVWVLFSIPTLFAQQPTSRLLPFTGAIPGQPDGSVTIRLRLFPVNVEGTFCFEETQTVAVVAETFVALIGVETPGGIPPSPCFTDNTSLWIASSLDTTPNVEIGDRTPIYATGYTFQASNADRLGGVPLSGLIRSTDDGGAIFTGNVGIGTKTPTAKLDVAGDIKTVRGGTVAGVKWTPVPKTRIGGLPVNPLGTVSFALTPSLVPPDAQEVLVYVFILTGNINPEGSIEFRIYTAEDTTEYSHYLFAYGYPQNAISYNSGTFWLPITSNRQIFVTSTGTALTRNYDSGVFVIGYR